MDVYDDDEPDEILEQDDELSNTTFVNPSQNELRHMLKIYTLNEKWKKNLTHINVKEMSLDKTIKSFGLILVTVVTSIQ